MSGYVLGIDIGGTGSRAMLAEALAPAGAGPPAVGTLTGSRVEIGTAGSTVLHVARELISAAREAWPEEFASITGIGIGATGIASLADDPTQALAAISAEVGAPAVAAIDAVTAHLGALGGSGGAVTVIGTGAIAIAHPGPDDRGIFAPNWSRADGWGHLFGDRGGGAWLGRRALELALRTHDGVDDSGWSLLEAASRRFGAPASWPAQFYTRGDRAGLLADFAADLADLGRAGDEAAIRLLAEAGREAARSALAAAAGGSSSGSSEEPQRQALTGGLAQAGGALLEGFRSEAARLHAHVTIVEPAGDPLAGAVTVARLGAGGRLRAQDGILWA
ncbi:MAG: BadF/BadG/BcrA/BcrD ATPase family protein [Brevibacterium sp.]